MTVSRSDLPELIDEYRHDLQSAQRSGIAADPEPQLTGPVSRFFSALVELADLGRLETIREAQLQGVRPDFAALIDGRPCGWIELKAPGHSLDGTTWRGREKGQWEMLAELDSLIVTDGTDAVLYSAGEYVATAALPSDGSEKWDPKPAVSLLHLFTSARPNTVTHVSDLANRLAPLARLLRDRIEVGTEEPTSRPPVLQAWEAWRLHVHDRATAKEFANDLAQVIAYSLAITALRGGGDQNADGLITLEEARTALKGPNDVLAAALGPALDVAGLSAHLAPEIGAIERLVSATDSARIARTRDSRGEPWLWFYEDFLAKYDAKARRQAGVYYTPIDVVQCQVRLCDHILTHTMGKRLGFGNKDVITLDPATGSGTYPLAVLDRAEQVALDVRGTAGPVQISKTLTKNLIAFELLPGPYALAHLRIGQRIAEIAHQLITPPHVRVYLTDTLDDPDTEVPTLGLWGDLAVLAQERAVAADVKRAQPVTVVIGNPPYARRNAKSGGGWVVHPASGRSLFDDIIQPAQQAGVTFAAQASLYNDYIYFWRWALWKAFQQDESRPAIVSFITASSWLDTPVFTGLRRLARELADDIWIIDLGGEGRGANTEDNVFAIQTPVAIVTMYRAGHTQTEPATVHYRRVTGTTADKLQAVSLVEPPTADSEEWTVMDVPVGERLIPTSGGSDWAAMPALTDLFPWQQPGVKYNRTWPISPSAETLRARWETLLAQTDATERARYFVTGTSGRNIHTKVGDYDRLSELPRGAASESLVRYGYRSFDRQWTFEDPRLAKTESPSLWTSRSGGQLYFSTMTTRSLGEGPGLTVTTAPPDLHHFRGSFGGKDVVPLYRDSQTAAPNLSDGLLDLLSTRYGRSVTPADLAAYVYLLLAQPGYVERFRTELKDPGPRVPLTAEAGLFDLVAERGRQLLWLHTYGERFVEPVKGRTNSLPRLANLNWHKAVQAIPVDMQEIRYDRQTRVLSVGSGQIGGVEPEVYDYTASGFPVVQRWLGSRTAKGIGRAASQAYATPLDLIRPRHWEDEWNDELLDLLTVLTHTVRMQPEQLGLLESVLAADLIPADDLPIPNAAARRPPR